MFADTCTNPGPCGGITAQLLIGASGTSVSTWASFAAAANPVDPGNNDEFMVDVPFASFYQAGKSTYRFVYRYSIDGGKNWAYGAYNNHVYKNAYEVEQNLGDAGTITVAPDCTGVANHVVISQFQVQGASSTDEFVELYNPTNADVAINGWKLRYKTDVGGSFGNLSNTNLPAGTIIKAHGYFLYTSNSGYTGTVTGDKAYTAGMANAAGHVQLYNGTVAIDTVGYGATADSAEGGHPASAPPANQSIKRKSFSSGLVSGFGNGYDTDDNASNFTAASASAPRNSASPIEASGCP